MREISLPNITADEPKDQIKQILSYLFQFKEEIELNLESIGMDNLDQDLRKRINALSNDTSLIKESAYDQEQKLNTVVKKDIITVSDVINSTQFKAALAAIFTSGDGYLKASDGTLICYGTCSSENMNFPVAFVESLPTVLSSPYTELTITMTNISRTGTTSFSYVAIGKYKTTSNS